MRTPSYRNLVMECLFFMTLSASLISLCVFFKQTNAADIITPTISLTANETLVSSDKVFELGFFSPINQKNLYLGIWYKRAPGKVVWVANRNNPITDINGTVLTINNNGSLVIFNQSRSIIWSSYISSIPKDPVAQLLSSGNFVLIDKSNTSSENYLWQSFDYPSDSLLANMKISWNANTGLEKYLTSWKTMDDPSTGDFTYKIEQRGVPQLVVRRGSIKEYRTGPMNGVRFSGLPTLINPMFKLIMEFNGYERSYKFESTNENRLVATIVTITESGLLQRLVLNHDSNEWTVMYTVPNEACDRYGYCGANGICKINNDPNCQCLPGFIPKYPEKWKILNWKDGCIRRTILYCQTGDKFLPVVGIKFPEQLNIWLNNTMTLEECKTKCFNNCSCTAYANSNVSGGASGCIMWFGDLIDIRELMQNENQLEIYIRLAASEIESIEKSKGRKGHRIIIIAPIFAAMFVLGTSVFCIIWKRKTKRRGLEEKQSEGRERINKDIDLPLFDLTTIAAATGNFSYSTLLGKGGFGSVYKGTLSSGREMAVKRLSKNSGQGLQEFMNEVVSIANLQHKNLVALLGCCIEGEERMLIYEYMPNKSLDHFIFDHKRSKLLGWQKRFDIIMGIAKGLMYLHEDSKLQIIHRDLKASNILLDKNLNPKISDFGLARIFGGDEIETETKKVVGTYGYMSPEYAYKGRFSVKSDVFSFGVLLLETISGKKIRVFSHPDHPHNLLGHAWLLWNEGKALDLIDTCLEESCVESQVMRCIQVGLLCVQKFPGDRPIMASVVFMLANEGAKLSWPKQPAFFDEGCYGEMDLMPTREESHTGNEITVSLMEAR